MKVRLRGHPVETATFTPLTDAKQWAQQTESEIRKGLYFKTSESKRHTVKELIQRYRNEHLARKANRPRVVTEQMRLLDWIEAELGAYLLFDLTPARIIEARGNLVDLIIFCAPMKLRETSLA